jgi:4-cresol dehydrogenase (hydroxylating) flavoprotein subunit
MEEKMHDRIISALRDIVGTDHVLVTPDEISRYARAEFPIQRRIPAVVRPGSTAEVQQVVRLAGEHGVALYPISTGKNWGYGSANPVRDDNLILDLSRMNRILEVNTELAYAVVQPGVTQQDLYEYLENNQTGLMMDPTGSGPSCSILGNSLERGYGITPHGDHFSFVCGLEVVLADGQVLHTGFGHFDHSKVTRVFKWGVGPYLDGIFTQSNFGIVTAMGVWLMPKPEHVEACYFSCEQEEDIYPLIGALRWLLQHNVIRSSVNLAHRNRVLTMLMQYPWEQMNGKTPLDPRLALQLAKDRKVGAWNGVCGIYGTKGEAREAKKVVRKVLRGKVSRINFVSSALLGFMERYPGPLSLVTGMNVRELVKVIKPSFGILSGKPSEVSLASPYWRSRKKPPVSNINPVADNCGLYWFAPVVPMVKENAREFINIVQTTLTKHGFEPCIMLSTVTNRCFDCNLPILYDKEDPEQTRKAGECYEDVFEACMQAGYIPYRVGIQSMERLISEEDPFWKTVRNIKSALDPQGILSPGRYCR